MRDIHMKAGEKRQPLNYVSGPSAKFMRSFYQRHPQCWYRMSESVDRGRINMASQETIQEYFQLLKTSLVNTGIYELDEYGNVENILVDRLYLADETGWGVSNGKTKVVAKKGCKRVFHRKPSDESHKTLMLTICGNVDVLKPMVILEKSFPLMGEGEVEQIPDGVLLSKPNKGSMEKDLFVEWLESPIRIQMTPVSSLSITMGLDFQSRLLTCALITKSRCCVILVIFPIFCKDLM